MVTQIRTGHVCKWLHVVQILVAVERGKTLEAVENYFSAKNDQYLIILINSYEVKKGFSIYCLL